MKILLILIVFTYVLFADSIDHQVKIIERIFSEISINKEMKIWSDNNDILLLIKDNSNFKTVESCSDANIIIIDKKKDLSSSCLEKYIFTLNYCSLSEITQSFGALFWKKGRPNIVIIEPRIREQNIKISKTLEPYLEDKVW